MRKEKKTTLPLAPNQTSLVPAEGAVPYDVAVKVMERAQAGDKTAVDDLRRLLDNPKATCVAHAQTAVMAMVEASSGQDLLSREVALRDVRLMKESLLGPNPTALERMLVDRVATCWYYVEDAERRYANSLNQSGGMSFDLGNYHQRRINAAQKRFNAAVLTLAAVRKMQLPEVIIGQVGQVNIGEQQVNVAEAATGIHT